MVRITDFDTSPTSIAGLLVITMKQVTDERGTVRELFRRSAFESAGLTPAPILQMNVTETRRGAVRGLHAEAMTKLVAVVAGEAFCAYVDLRQDSPTRGNVVTITVVPGIQVLVPEGVGNGFQALADGTQYAYCFDREWQADMPGTACNPFDPALGIEWPLPVDRSDRGQVSAKDLAAPSLADVTVGSAS